MNPKAVIAVMLCGTACTVLLTFVIAACFYPPGTISETSRENVWKTLFLMIGVVSGYLLKDGMTPPPSEPPKA